MDSWIAANIHWFLIVIGICTCVTKYVDYQHMKANKYERGDFGYFWRLMKAGDRDGIVVTFFSGIALLCGTVLVGGLVLRIVTT